MDIKRSKGKYYKGEVWRQYIVIITLEFKAIRIKTYLTYIIGI